VKDLGRLARPVVAPEDVAFERAFHRYGGPTRSPLVVEFAYARQLLRLGDD